MRMIESDYAFLDNELQKRRMHKYADVQHRLERVAFDVVRFKDADGLDKLWRIEDLNGEKVIVAMYSDEEPEGMVVTASSSWAAIQDSSGKINVFYKGEPITKFATNDIGIPKEEGHMVCKSLPVKLADEKFRAKFLAGLSREERAELNAKYPELRI